MTAIRMRRTLDAKGTDAVITAAEKRAIRNGYRVVIAIVDAWGHVLQLRRTEGAQAASGQVAIDKARTAAIFVRHSRHMRGNCRDRRDAVNGGASHGSADGRRMHLQQRQDTGSRRCLGVACRACR